MKRIGLFLMCLLCAPYIAHASDHCTNPDEYTVDKRCYVTDEQKKEKPYNATVALRYSRGTYCTGTIIKHDGHFYLYTAKHCTGNADKTMKVSLQDGRNFTVLLNKTGDYDMVADSGFSGDWAIYQFYEKDKDVPSVDFSKNIAWGSDNKKYAAHVIGYGSLKIMSDKEIEDFKQGYIDLLKQRNPDVPEKVFMVKELREYFGFTEDGGVDLLSTPGKVYRKGKGYSKDIFGDGDNLKVSHCKYTSSGRGENCQVWDGNSGGGVFDDSGNLMAIITRGNRIIGGSEHAGSGIGYYYGQIDLLDKPGQMFSIKPSEIKNPSFNPNDTYWHPPLR